LKVSASPDGTSARLVTVVPLPGENTLRLYNWVQDNRRKVAQMSGGKLG
jgi:tricorn protease